MITRKGYFIHCRNYSECHHLFLLLFPLRILYTRPNLHFSSPMFAEKLELFSPTSTRNETAEIKMYR